MKLRALTALTALNLTALKKQSLDVARILLWFSTHPLRLWRLIRAAQTAQAAMSGPAIKAATILELEAEFRSCLGYATLGKDDQIILGLFAGHR